MIRLVPDPVVVASAGPLPSATLHETTASFRHECRNTINDRVRRNNCQEIISGHVVPGRIRPGSLRIADECVRPYGKGKDRRTGGPLTSRWGNRRIACLSQLVAGWGEQLHINPNASISTAAGGGTHQNTRTTEVRSDCERGVRTPGRSLTA